MWWRVCGGQGMNETEEIMWLGPERSCFILKTLEKLKVSD